LLACRFVARLRRCYFSPPQGRPRIIRDT
jgi:hypothetical protein